MFGRNAHIYDIFRPRLTLLSSEPICELKRKYEQDQISQAEYEWKRQACVEAGS
jgi:hypothetical protein